MRFSAISVQVGNLRQKNKWNIKLPLFIYLTLSKIEYFSTFLSSNFVLNVSNYRDCVLIGKMLQGISRAEQAASLLPPHHHHHHQSLTHHSLSSGHSWPTSSDDVSHKGKEKLYVQIHEKEES